ncbi:MAG: hypothetical protein UX91_C0001G0116 [Candidatus Amesbacteria bacterium GW2011_GWB1_47_19]|nr:MAG: hypothetical protein UW51_C0001G0116 [Candidatus Amesbacteria bacterium GW2011_GWA1_44_24]KKU32128.1 MAG: seg [Candidatus Amesbacteria bacterium GW2011_GWC1_46_24]KKU67812.1 MAG: hypothetical protein UX91_C0001G0116 [Candidatus Amesbacteria bacterium GW2011_GWB1_47_19]OGD05026.1 MAG: hypothetical protein A2379_03940 [Candidatus Amesbacteria bacterium RIFOXYB1_FULL_47_13]HBC72412.1 hypothetical protein [Candidatus Amesbacteria bacterium]
MEQHPVPQNISSYEFRLVGDMTLKQFLYLAGGLVMAFLIFRTPLPVIIKYPAVFICAVMGAAMAFLPINGRPFAKWISAFMKAIYSPTEFVWAPSPPSTKTVPRIPAAPPPAAPLSPATSFTSFVTSLAPEPAPEPSPVISPPPAESPFPTAPTPVTLPSTFPGTARVQSPATPDSPTQTAYHAFTPPPQISPVTAPAEAAVPEPVISPLPAKAAPSASSVVSPLPPLPNIPLTGPGPRPTITPPPPAPQATLTSAVTAPTQPNILSGQINDSAGSPMSGVTLEILDSQTGIPARALRTNRLGQFQIAIPLPSGSYVINSEKDGFNFPPVSIKVANSLIPPIVITAQPQNA